jgi:hypothetical protein
VDTTVLEIAARSAGVLPQAVEDAVRRLAGHFSTMADPTPDLISQQLLQLRENAPHLFTRPSQIDASGVPSGIPPEVWKGLSPATKLGWAREHGHGLPPVERRAKPLVLSPEQAAQFAQMRPADRLTAYRTMQQAQQRP